MAVETVDAVVIGLGPGGEEAALRLAEGGLSVVGIENRLVGGVCPFWGCVPSKMMIRAGNLLAEARRVSTMAGDAEVTPSWAPVRDRLRHATDFWNDGEHVRNLKSEHVRVVRGAGRLLGRGSVEVGGLRFQASKAIVVATGTKPTIPPIAGLDGTPFWSNREAIEATEVPDSLVVLGGGAIGVELAQVFSRFGSQVTVIESADRLLPPDEPEASELLETVFQKEGIRVMTGVRAISVKYEKGFRIQLDDGETVPAQQLLVATGRHTDLDGLGAEAIGVDSDAEFLDVDDRLRVTDGVWGIGDVTGKGNFTHVAVYQAAIATADILGESHAPADYRAVPAVAFTDPEIGSVGLTEKAAREAGFDVAVGSTRVPTTARGWIHQEGNDGLVKLVADLKAEVLVGATSAGPAGGEVLGLLTLAVHARVSLDTLRSMIYAYPTFHRGVEDALRELSADAAPN